MPDTTDRLREAFLVLFRETFQGKAGDGSWFVESHENGGLIANLRRVTADQASRPSAGGGPSIAAHAAHVRWFLNLAARLSGANAQDINWSAPENQWKFSWPVSTVDDAQWQGLIAGIEREAQAVEAGFTRPMLDSLPGLDETCGVLTVLPHAAYHLGAIRALIRTVLAQP
ncbi:MAG TPA: hypothetical protein VHN99_05885 [Deinococcales bacterium]|nr:hypothetical protein [Deinococcales bacterium]